MEQILKPVFGGGAFLLALAIGVKWFRIKHQVDSARRPVSEKLLRSPGESLRKKKEELDEKLIWRCLFASFLTIVGAMLVSDVYEPLSWAAVFALASLGLVPVFKTLKTFRAYDLGLAGERAVGEELNLLMLEGHRVYHDYPAGPTWNIDHIVVGRSGVFAIETKTRRKKRPKDGGPDHEIVFDGRVLKFPCETTTCGLKQARHNAASLGDQLSKSLAEPIHVQPILTFPGWFVTRKGKSDVCVVNPGQIRQCIITEGPPQLSLKQIERICARLEERCRDVEF